MSEDKILKVRNRSDGVVIYKIPELGVRREFFPNEEKPLKESELIALTSIPGGRELMYHFLFISEDANKIMNVEVEPEYYLTENEIPKWLETCSVDELKDALDFAPEGVKELIKKYAVEQKLNDMNKRKAILEQLGFDVTTALNLIEETEEDKKKQGNTQRRVPKKTNDLPQYKVVN